MGVHYVGRIEKMKVKELIKQLEQIQNKDVEVFVLNQFDGFSKIYEVEPFNNCAAISGDIKSEELYGMPAVESVRYGGQVTVSDYCIAPHDSFEEAKAYLAQLASEGEDDEFVVGKVVKCHFPVIHVDEIIDNDRELHELDYGLTDYLSDVTQKQKNDLETILTMTYNKWLEINHLESNAYGLDDEVLFRLNPITGKYEEDKSYANEMP